MWSRIELKDGAKNFLRGNYLLALGVVLIMVVLGGYEDNSTSLSSNSTNYESMPLEKYNQREIMEDGTAIVHSDIPIVINKNDQVIYKDGEVVITKSMPWGSMSFIRKFFSPPWEDYKEIAIGRFISKHHIGYLTIFNFFLGISILFSIFISGPIHYGGTRFFLHGARGDTNFSKIWDGFISGRYLSVVGTIFMTKLYNFLWFLLLIIPGIVKAYAYSMVPYILSDYPDLSYDQVIRKSIDLTEGHKWNMFVLDLSFIGWYLLGSALFGIGRILVHPYYSATKAQLYLKLIDIDKEKNLTDGYENRPPMIEILSDEI